jgi:Domain of unknown function (DUF4266)
MYPNKIKTIKLHMAKRMLKMISLATMVSFILASCANVKEYQKSRINDSEMILGNRKVEKNELNFQSYREGASGANGGKTGGGCGCN